MRLVTWNCHHGTFEKRIAELRSLRPNVAVLQECSSSAETGMWFPTTSRKGVGIWAGAPYSVRQVPCQPEVTHSVYPAAVDGPEPFHLLAVWAQSQPSYVAAIIAGLTAYTGFVREAPTVVVGDFNSSPVLRDSAARRAHDSLIERMRADWGLVSAYHHRSGTMNSPEMPTYYHQFDGAAGYHLDYCFVPIDWVPRLSSVTVAGVEEFTSSDHRPLLVEVSPVRDSTSVA